MPGTCSWLSCVTLGLGSQPQEKLDVRDAPQLVGRASLSGAIPTVRSRDLSSGSGRWEMWGL